MNTHMYRYWSLEFGRGASVRLPLDQDTHTYTPTDAPQQEGGEGRQQVIDGAKGLVPLQVGREEAQARRGVQEEERAEVEDVRPLS